MWLHLVHLSYLQEKSFNALYDQGFKCNGSKCTSHKEPLDQSPNIGGGEWGVGTGHDWTLTCCLYRGNITEQSIVLVSNNKWKTFA